MIKEEFGGRKRAGCERGVAAAKERNAIKASALVAALLFSFPVSGSGQSREEGRDELGVCTQRKTKNTKGAPIEKRSHPRLCY